MQYLVHRASIKTEAVDEGRSVGFINMLLNDVNQSVDAALGDLEEIHNLELLLNSSSPKWTNLSDQKKQEEMECLNQIRIWPKDTTNSRIEMSGCFVPN
jgi:Ubiquitin elongating factor core